MVTIRGPPRGRLGVLMPELSGTGVGVGMSGKGIDGDGEAGGLFSGDTGLEARGDCEGGGGVALGGVAALALVTREVFGGSPGCQSWD